MTLVNNAMSRDPEEGVTLLTAFFAIVDLDVGVMTYANGGHETPVLRRPDGTVEELLYAAGDQVNEGGELLRLKGI